MSTGFGFEGDLSSKNDEDMDTVTAQVAEPASVSIASRDEVVDSEESHSSHDLVVGDIVVFKFCGNPCLGYVFTGLNARQYKIVPLRESSVDGKWLKAGKIVTKERDECIKLPARLSDMSICI